MDLTLYQRKITYAFLKLSISLSIKHRDFPKIDDSPVHKLSTTDTLFRHMLHICLFIDLLISLITYLLIYLLFIFIFFYLFIYLFIYLFYNLSIYFIIYLFICLFIYLFIYLFMYLFILQFIIIKFVAIEDVINFSSLSRDDYFVFVKL